MVGGNLDEMIVSMSEYMKERMAYERITTRPRVRTEFFAESILTMQDGTMRPCKINMDGMWVLGMCSVDTDEIPNEVEYLPVQAFFQLANRDMQLGIYSGWIVAHDGRMYPSSRLAEGDVLEVFRENSPRFDAHTMLVSTENELVDRIDGDTL